MSLYSQQDVSSKESIALVAPEILSARASEGLLALSMELGLEVLRQMLETEAEALAGTKGKYKATRKAYRHGTEKSRVVMGSEKVPAARPRIRSVEGGELPLETLSLFQQEDPLNRALLQRLLCGVSTRKYARTLDANIADASCISKSEVSRRFAQGLEAQVEAFYKRPIEGSYPMMMLGGLELGFRLKDGREMIWR